MRPIYQAVTFLQALSSSAIVLAVGLLLWFIFDDLPVSAFGILGWWSWPLGVLAGAAGYAIVFLITKQFLMGSNAMRDLMEKLASLFRNFSWPAIFVISAMAGISEELLLRGLIQTGLIEFTTPIIGIVVASLIFGLMHFLSKTYVLVTFVLGLAFGVAYYFSNSLVFVMVAHAVYDVFAFVVLVKYPRSLGIRGG